MNNEVINKQSIVDFAESILEDNRTVGIRMTGYSMYPTLRPGDIGHIEKCVPNKIKVGDIVVFKLNGKLIAHRLVAINNHDVRTFVAKGDKNKFSDPPFATDAFVGKITSFERKGRKISAGSFGMRVFRYLALHCSKPVIAFCNFELRVSQQIRSLLANLRSLKNNVTVISKGSGKLFWINAIISVLQGIIPFAVIVLIKLLVDELTTSSLQNSQQQFVFISLLIVTALVFLLNVLLTELRAYFSEKLTQSVTRYIYSLLQAKHSVLDLSNYENPDKQDKIHRAVQEASFRPIKILNALLMGIKSVASVLFLIGLFVSIRWYMVLILLVAILPDVFVRLKYSGKLYRLKDSQSTREREMYYYNRILTGFPFAKELKLFGFSGFFQKRFTQTQNSLFDEKIALRKSELSFNIFAQVFAVVLIFISLGFVSYLKMKGEISIGTVVLFFFAFQRGYSVLNDFFRSFTQIIEDNTFLKDFIEFLNLPAHSKEPTETVEFSLKKEIRFDNVSFRYEASMRDALKNINISIPAGKTVAFVGANGSGKTTLIKLLCGFYEPNAGKIMFDNQDSILIGQKKICKNITAVFQDFALYNISVAENLALGNIQISLDMEKAKKAAQAAGIDDVLEQLPNGYHTLLGNLFKGGEELSIGQWQKMAIARAFYRDAPLLLMDEPSSALDAESEMQIIKSLRKLSHEKTAIIVSHRLTTVQWADLIYLFHEGEMIESGNHKELMALKGKYYNLFQTVNSRFE
ncbi:MAG: signal peptidase I [Paludibacter sp.]